MGKVVFAVKDTHTEPSGRNRAQAMLNSGGISIFFIEWPKPIVDVKYVRNNFIGLAKNDACPNLIQLTVLALQKNIAVVSCDLSVDQTLIKLKQQDDLKGINSGFVDNSAFQPWGQAIRDRHAAAIIQNYMLLHEDGDCRGLVMFGTNHFKKDDDREAAPLDRLISIKGVLDCCIVSNQSPFLTLPPKTVSLAEGLNSVEEVEMSQIERARYTLEFRVEAVRLVQSGQSIAAVSRKLGITDQTLQTWLDARNKVRSTFRSKFD